VPKHVVAMLLAGSMLLAINTCKYVLMPTSQGRSIHYNNPLYNRLAGGISNVVGRGRLEGRLERKLDLRPIRELILTSNRELGVSTTNRLVRTFIKGQFGRLARSIVGGRLVVVGLVVAGGLIIAGLIIELVARLDGLP
jgi:hypothetical protein